MIGEVPGVRVGAIFDTRAALHAAGVHREMQAGICGRAATGAESIVLAGGYTDDTDRGDEIVYAGAGGRDAENKRQTADQSFAANARTARWNRSLVVSCEAGLPVRVVRGHQTRLGPSAGYRYDGLWRVTDYWMAPGWDGPRVCLFHLVPEATRAVPVRLGEDDQTPFDVPERATHSSERVVRDPALVLRINGIYDYRCQACGVRVETLAGPHAEAAHIRPLGTPHHGPDVLANMLCLCPNCHAAFDRGGWTVRDGVAEWLDGTARMLAVKRGHGIDPAHLAYHRATWRGDR